MSNIIYFVYIIECSDGSYYTGISHDIEKRIDRHNQGNGCEYTKNRRPVKLLYSEKCNSYQAAFIREKEIKGWRREKKERLFK